MERFDNASSGGADDELGRKRYRRANLPRVSLTVGKPNSETRGCIRYGNRYRVGIGLAATGLTPLRYFIRLHI